MDYNEELSKRPLVHLPTGLFFLLLGIHTHYRRDKNGNSREDVGILEVRGLGREFFGKLGLIEEWGDEEQLKFV